MLSNTHTYSKITCRLLKYRCLSIYWHLLIHYVWKAHWNYPNYLQYEEEIPEQWQIAMCTAIYSALQYVQLMNTYKQKDGNEHVNHYSAYNRCQNATAIGTMVRWHTKTAMFMALCTFYTACINSIIVHIQSWCNKNNVIRRHY